MRKFLSAIFAIALFTSCASDSGKENQERTSRIQLMESPTDSVSAEPYLFTDKNNVVYLSWISKEAKKSTLKYSILKDGKWGKPLVIATGDNWFVNWADYPVIASDGNNNLISHFLQKSEEGVYTYDIKMMTSSDYGQSWSDPKILHDDGKKAEHGFVSIVPYDENYFISWLDGRNSIEAQTKGHNEEHHGEMTIRGAIVDKAGKKLQEWELDRRVCDCCQTTAAITSNGPVVVYRDRSEEEIRDMSIVRYVNGQWTEPKLVFADNWKIDGCPVNGPRITADGKNLALAWFTSPDKDARVNIVFSEDAGATFTKPIRVDEGNSIGRVDIELLDGKTAIVCWMEGGVIKARRVASTGEIGSATVIASASESRSSGFPQITKSGDQIVFAWTDEKEKKIKVVSASKVVFN